MRSIRAGLLRWLVGSLVAASLATLLVTYLLTSAQLATVFDDELRQVAHAVQLREDWIRAGRVRIARPGFSLSLRAYDAAGRTYFETKLPSLPEDLPQSQAEGFSQVATADGEWRVYTHVTGEGTVQVGQPVAARRRLAREMSLRVLTPSLAIIPVVVLLIGWILQRSLAPLEETSRRVGNRDAVRLDPLPTESVPTELMPLVEQVNALIARLARSLDAQRAFLADAAHELRTPVGALALQVQLAEGANSPEERAAAMAELAGGIERTRRVVQQLLDYARFEPGAADAPREIVDLAALAREVVGRLAIRAEERSIDLGAEAPEPAPLLASRSQLTTLLENLVDNALRYAPAHTAVTVAVAVRAGEVVVSVRDHGPGVIPADRERVFRRFERAPGDVTAGTGLGLAIAKSIIEGHDGRVELADTCPGEPSPGLTITATFPGNPAQP